MEGQFAAAAILDRSRFSIVSGPHPLRYLMTKYTRHYLMTKYTRTSTYSRDCIGYSCEGVGRNFFTMFQVILAGVTVLTLLGISDAQCSTAQQIQFIASLGSEGIQCGLDLAAVNSTPTDAALNGSCTEACAGAVAQWLAGPTCNDNFSSAGLLYWCQPADGGRISRCRFVNESLFNSASLASCGIFATNPASSCPSNCAMGLRSMSEEIGCCYQALYNNTEGLDGLQQAGEISGPERIFFDLLGNTTLWNICNVDVPVTCTSPPVTPNPTIMATTMVTEADSPTASGIKLKFSISVIVLMFIMASIY